MNENCGCCDGIEILTPIPIANRPGLDALLYRLGTHASFLETMMARLSNFPLDILFNQLDDQGKQKIDTLYPLQGLTTRSQDDPAIALLDAWATLADVLTFYQERIANEGYLRTATERRSILELARLVGYALRPGVAASVYLAYILEKDHDVILLPGNRAQSVPGPGELPQAFETAEKLEARFAWNALKARLTRPQFITGTGLKDSAVIFPNISTNQIYLQGTATKLKAGDPLLFLSLKASAFAFLTISSIDQQTADSRTKVLLQSTSATATTTGNRAMFIATRGNNGVSLFRSLVDPLSIPPSLQPRNTQRLERSVSQAFSTQSDIHPQLLIQSNPLLQQTLYSALANVDTTGSQALQLTDVKALRVKAALFGHNLPLPQTLTPPPEVINIVAEAVQPTDDTVVSAQISIALDAEYKDIIKGSWVVVERRDQGAPSFTFATVADVQTITLGGYPGDNLRFFETQGSTSTSITDRILTTTTSDPVKIKVSVLTLSRAWLTKDELKNLSHATRQALLSSTTVYAFSEDLTFAEEPLRDEIRDDSVQTKRVGTDTIELDGIYDGLKSGQRLIISGERSDVLQADGITPIPGIEASELVMLAAVIQDVAKVQNPDGSGLMALPGDKKHTFLTLAKPLAYTYKRNTVTINANVVRATHGETRNEVLGSGDGSKALQQFALRQSPLTYLAAPTPAGAASTLQVRVNDILWHEVESLAGADKTDRRYVTETDDSGKTTVIFGNGQHGARLPSGVENVKAIYRTGIGKPGNVRAEQISLLATKPLGVKSVLNPLRASGGADKESGDQARRNVPLALLALDRLVSVQDYQDFARTYAGIGKANAVRLSDSYRQFVHLTIAGADNIPIDINSDLYLNLFQALLQFGDPNQPLKVDLAEVLFLILSFKVRLLPDYQLESVEPKIRTKLLDTYSFDRRELGQSVFQSEVLSVIQGTVGVDYVELEVMAAVGQEQVLNAFDTLLQRKTPEPEEGGENPDEEKGETPDQENAEEFLELLGLTDHQDIVVKLARINPQPIDPNDPTKPPIPILPAQLVFLSPDVPDTLIITELPQ